MQGVRSSWIGTNSDWVTQYRRVSWLMSNGRLQVGWLRVTSSDSQNAMTVIHSVHALWWAPNGPLRIPKFLKYRARFWCFSHMKWSFRDCFLEKSSGKADILERERAPFRKKPLVFSSSRTGGIEGIGWQPGTSKKWFDVFWKFCVCLGVLLWLVVTDCNIDW